MNGSNIICIQIFLSLSRKNLVIENTFDDTMVDDLMDQVFIQVNCSLDRASIELVRLSKISSLMNHSQKIYIQILFRL
jgi:hypothetical protein